MGPERNGRGGAEQIGSQTNTKAQRTVFEDEDGNGNGYGYGMIGGLLFGWHHKRLQHCE